MTETLIPFDLEAARKDVSRVRLAHNGEVPVEIRMAVEWIVVRWPGWASFMVYTPKTYDLLRLTAPPPREWTVQLGEEWVSKTMQMINNLTPDVKGKAFDPDWFLLRQRFEEVAAIAYGHANPDGSVTVRASDGGGR